jgi:hypothetical protein
LGWFKISRDPALWGTSSQRRSASGRFMPNP